MFWINKGIPIQFADTMEPSDEYWVKQVYSIQEEKGKQDEATRKFYDEHGGKNVSA